ncbi:MAG: biotin/lipoyl-binding protein, partial [Alphaproteobacteria bacterium]|nr:biotin/lipoyl-binding protein [Alphaproteobacteria bacterium]
MRSGSIVRFLYACAIVIFIGILGWNFARGLLFLEGTGTISAKKMVIAYPFPVRIKSVNVTPGSDVKAGDVLLRLDDTQTRANLAIVTKAL